MKLQPGGLYAYNLCSGSVSVLCICASQVLPLGIRLSLVLRDLHSRHNAPDAQCCIYESLLTQVSKRPQAHASTIID